MPLTTLARWLRRLADRLDPPIPYAVAPPGFVDMTVDCQCYECGYVLEAGEGRPTRCPRCGDPTTWFPVGTFEWRYPPNSGQ